MAEAEGRCNSTREGVFQHVDPALTIDQGQVDPDIGQETLRFSGKNSSTVAKMRAIWACEICDGGQVVRAALLHLDKNDHIAVATDQIDFPAGAAPVAGADRDAAVFVVAGDRRFRRMAGKIVRHPAGLAGLMRGS